MEEMPVTNQQWLYLLVIGALLIGGSALGLINEIQQVLATHEHILEDLPAQVTQTNHNVIRICTYLEIHCES